MTPDQWASLANGIVWLSLIYLAICILVSWMERQGQRPRKADREERD